MKKFLVAGFLVSMFFSSKCQLDSLSRIEYDTKLNDVWGYVDTSGNEYALVGLRNGLSIVEVTNPSNPIEVYRSSGPQTIWRDIKVYGNYAYVTNEADSGLRIYDLSVLPISHEIPYKDFDGEDGKNFETAHNLFIDEKGRAFVVGTNRSNGMIVYDLVDDPWNPKEIGFYADAYIHDIYVRNDTAYPALIVQGDFYILDVSDMNNIQLVSSHPTKDLQTHNTWLSMDGNYLFTTDEVDGAEVGVYDVSDKSNPEKVEFFKSRLLGDEMPHNILVRDSVAFISYYKDGIIALDVSNPENVLEVGRFDTDKSESGPGSSGSWGVYPFLPSGNILASDIENGLYVLGFSNQNAAYLEGIVKDKQTGFPLSGVSVKVLEEGKEDETYFDGAYKVGKIGGGELLVEFSLSGYKKKTLTIDVIENQIHTEDVLLEKLETGSFVMNLSLQDGVNPSGASAHIYGENYEQKVDFDSSGTLVRKLPEGDYTVYVGKWGYANYCFNQTLDSLGDTVLVELVKGYYDDFSANQGWQVYSVHEDPIWERTQPKASYSSTTGMQHDPSEDATIDDCNDWAFCTGINENFSASSTTVNWTNFLVSPEVEISSPNVEATISFSYWLGFSEQSNDTIKVGVVHGSDTTYLKYYTSNDELLQWKEASFTIGNVINSSSSFKFIVRVTDDLDPWSMVDCAIDEFSVVFSNSVDETVQDCLESLNNGWMNYCENKEYFIMNSIGQVVKIGQDDFIDLKGFESGVYIIKVKGYIPQKIYWNEEKW